MSETVILLSLATTGALAAGLATWVVVTGGSAALERHRLRFNARTRSQLAEFFLFIDPRELYAACLGLMVITAIATLAMGGGWVLAVAAVAIVGVLPRKLITLLRRRRLQRLEAQLPEALMMLAAGMRAGSSLVAAMRQYVAEGSPPLAQELDLVMRELRLGVQLGDALHRLGQRVPTQTITLIVAAMRVATETGGGLAEALERAATTVRARLEMEGKIRALTAQGKLQAWIVGLLPVALAGILNQLEPEAMAALWDTRMGWAVLAVLVLLEVIGVHLVRRIVAIDV